tara:strand:+ start:284 stop:844 length:561 start_codon:yes stop_codon:yes gene_type:complete
MKILQLKSDEINQLNLLSTLHKKIFLGTIATTLSISNLSKLYALLIKSKIISVNVAFGENDYFLGALTVKLEKNHRTVHFFDYFKIIIILLQGLLSHPIIWLTEYYYKVGLYKNIDAKVNIITLFVDKKHQGKGTGEKLIKSVKDQYQTKISVDTRTNNQRAIDFYIKNGFVLKNKNIKNTSLYFT